MCLSHGVFLHEAAVDGIGGRDFEEGMRATLLHVCVPACLLVCVAVQVFCKTCDKLQRLNDEGNGCLVCGAEVGMRCALRVLLSVLACCFVQVP